MKSASFLKNALFIALALLLWTCKSQKTEWDVREFGAVGDSVRINTLAIQEAIDACQEAGGGTVTLKSGAYVSGTILLKNKVRLHVAADASLLGSVNPLDYQSIDPFVDATGQIRGRCLVGALDASQLAITGKGIINGRGDLFKSGEARKILENLNLSEKEIKQHLSDRPFLVRFVRCTDVEVLDIHLRQPAAWTLHFFQCGEILVDGISIYSHAHSNNDGIDMDSSHDGIIRNCDIDSGDDAICFKTTSPLPTKDIMVHDCLLKSHWGAIKFGTESMGDFQNISIKNCEIQDTRGGGIKILSVDGANIDNIVIDSIRMSSVDMPIFIRLGERLRTYRDAPKQEVGSINNVSISNVTATTRGLDESRVSPPSGIFITGTPTHKIGHIKLENIHITLPGGGTAEQAKLEVAEDEERYPEFSFFGVLPGYGVFARHVEKMSISKVEFLLSSTDERKESIYLDVK